MTFDLISGLHLQIQTWHPPLRLCIHANYYVKSGLTNVLKNANKTKNMHLFFNSDCQLDVGIQTLVFDFSLNGVMMHTILGHFDLDIGFWPHS